MRKYMLWLLLAAMIFAGFAGCGSSNNDPQPTPVVSLTLSKTSVTSDGGTIWATVATAADATWDISLEDPINGDDWGATVTPQTGTGPTNLVQIYYPANVAADARSLNVTLSSMDKTSIKTLAQAGTEPEPIPDQDKLTGWKELPSSNVSQTTIVNSSSNTMFNCHFTTIGGNVMRSFSMLYDKQEKISYWVAYPLASVYLGSQDRSKNFIFDPNIPQAYQPDLTRTYSEYYSTPSYNRGHQIPSADRTSDAASNQQTYYFTNMTPQLASVNSGIWMNLETSMVRANVARCDTLYVVTGSVLRTVGGNETVSYAHTQDAQSTPVAIPNYYFKVLVQCKIVNGVATYPAGIAFWIPHTMAVVGTNYKTYAMTIRQVETKTGFNFFSNLPQDVQDVVENDNTNWSTKWAGM